MNLDEARKLMATVQAVENEHDDLIDKSELAELLASQVRLYIEDEAEMGGWYSDLMEAIGETGLDGQPVERVTLATEAKASRDAASKLAGAPAKVSASRQDPNIG